MSIEARIMEQVIEKSGKDVTVEYHETQKNNGIIYKGYRIKEVGSTLAPIVYYEDSLSEDEIVEHVVRNYCEALSGGVPDISVEKIFTKEYVLANVWPAFINIERNAELLKDAVHDHYLEDIAIIYKVEVDMYGNGKKDGAITITHSHLKPLKITRDELHDNAIKNVQGKGLITPLSKMMKAMCPDMDADVSENPMLLISNQRGWYGCSVIFDEEIKNIFKQLGEAYIIPSSVDEFIAVPIGDGEEAKFLAQLIKHVNETELEPEQFLSNNLFKFDGYALTKVEV